MTVKVVGVEVREGTYNNIDYSNWLLYVPKLTQSTVGDCFDIVKVKSFIFRDIQPVDLIGREVDIYYNRFGRVESVIY